MILNNFMDKCQVVCKNNIVVKTISWISSLGQSLAGVCKTLDMLKKGRKEGLNGNLTLNPLIAMATGLDFISVSVKLCVHLLSYLPCSSWELVDETFEINVPICPTK